MKLKVKNNCEKKKIKNGIRGITLIALIVTIIVLLVLAGVSISMLTGENGILKNVVEAKEKTGLVEKQEKAEISNMEELINNSLNETDIEEVNDSNPGKLEKEDEDTFVINSIEDLVVFAYDVRNGNNYEGKTVMLGHSLDFNSSKSYADAFRTDYGKYGYNGKLKEEIALNKGWNSIGDEINIGQNNFKGIFEGNNKNIYNLYINQMNIEETKYIGFFANNQGIIKNLNLKNTKIKSSGDNEIYYFIAGIAGNNEGTIMNCTTDGDYQSEGNYALISGITGRNQGILEMCINRAKISGEAKYISGIAAQNLAQVRKCGNEGEIDSKKNGRYIGGIVGLGDIDTSIVEESFNIGNIFAELNDVGRIGGIIGQAQCDIKNCYNVGSILANINTTLSANPSIGGIIGLQSHALENSYNIGSIKVTSTDLIYIGGIVGKYDRWLIKNVYSQTLFKLNDNLSPGALIGFKDINATVFEMKNLCFYGQENAIGDNSTEINDAYINIKEKPNQSKILEIVNADEESKFIDDTKGINEGYPILYWQELYNKF